MFESIIKDRVTLVKSDGTINREGIPAHVQPKLIVLLEINLHIETGDHILRQLENGEVEDFIVDHSAFYDKTTSGMSSHFQIKVTRSGQVSKQERVIQNILRESADSASSASKPSIETEEDAHQRIAHENILWFLNELSPLLEYLPDDQRLDIESELLVLAQEIEKPKPSQLILRSALQSIKILAKESNRNLISCGLLGLMSNFAFSFDRKA